MERLKQENPDMDFKKLIIFNDDSEEKAYRKFNYVNRYIDFKKRTKEQEKERIFYLTKIIAKNKEVENKIAFDMTMTLDEFKEIYDKYASPPKLTRRQRLIKYINDSIKQNAEYKEHSPKRNDTEKDLEIKANIIRRAEDLKNRTPEQKALYKKYKNNIIALNIIPQDFNTLTFDEMKNYHDNIISEFPQLVEKFNRVKDEKDSKDIKHEKDEKDDIKTDLINLARDREAQEEIAKQESEIYTNLKKTYLNKNRVMKKEHVKQIIRLAKPVDRLGISFTDENGQKIIRNINFTSRENREAFLTALFDGYGVENIVGSTPSDGNVELLLYRLSKPRLIQIKKHRRRGKAGHYFAYSNETKIPLHRYQIYKSTGADYAENKDKFENGNKHCLIRCLELYGVASALLNRITLSFEENTYFEKKNLLAISNIIEKSIILHFADERKADRVRSKQQYGRYPEIINIGLLEKHYFINEPVQYTAFFSKNYNKCKDYTRGADIVKFTACDRKVAGPRYRTTEAYTDSFTLIKNLFVNNHFTPIACREHETLTKIGINLQNIENEQKEFEFKTPEIRAVKTFYADTETTVNSEGKHIIYMAGVVNEECENAMIFKDGDIITEMFDYVMDDTDYNDIINIYFHNLKYDASILQHSLFYKTSIEKGNTMYSIKILHKGRTFNLIDSYKLISVGLKKFKKDFQLDFGKAEAIAYTFYKTDTPDIVSVEEYKNALAPADRKTFMDVLTEDGEEFEYDEKAQTFNCVEYYKMYLNFDCLTLRAGLQKFNTNIEIFTDGALNISNCLTISSLGHKYFSMNGAYDGLYNVCGNLRAYISKAITGGRVHINPLYKKVEIDGPIKYLDIVSLYPSAMARLCSETGYATGKATYFSGEPVATACYFIATVKITKINKFQQMAMVCHRQEGKLLYVNEINEPITVYIDKITLEDWIQFCLIEFEIIEGVQWCEGYNNTAGEVVHRLAGERARYKTEKNETMSTLIKLILNSAYGKTIQKTSNQQIIYRDNEDYIAKYFDVITEYREKGRGQYRIIKNVMDDSYNLGHVGVQILSMSKRIMNEIFNVFNDLKIAVLYTDTDSLHCVNNGLQLVRHEYERRYGRALIGSNLGQLQHDFTLDGANEKKEIYATNSIFLGRKCYIDKITDGKRTGLYYKMKGVPEHSIKNLADEKYEGDVYKVYQALARGEKLKFVLNPSILQPSFEFRNTAGIYTRPIGTFSRELEF
jgi:hypothetical protein